MELQWKSAPCSYMRSMLRQVQNQEQTLELRLTDGMPDIGRVLCAWGQIQLRSKEWRTDTIHVGGGINVWALYMPEDGTEPQCVEGWMPFQGKWPLPEHSKEGVICADVALRSLDGRTISPRKMLLRASVALLAEAMEQQQVAVYTPDELPEGVCLLKQSYPLQLLQEAGEKIFSVEQTLPLSGVMPKKILACNIVPLVTEQAVTAGRMVMRGHLEVNYVALEENGHLYSNRLEMPFAQFAELERDHDKEASSTVTMALSDVTWMLEPEGLRVKCGLVAQYGIYAGCLLQVAEDAYSPKQSLVPKIEQLQMPVLLDRLHPQMEADMELPIQARNVVDVVFSADQPAQYREADRLVVELPGVFQVLYYDQDDMLQCATRNWSGRWELPAGDNCCLRLGLRCCGASAVSVAADRVNVIAHLQMDVQTCAEQQIPMVTGLQMGERIAVDPKRPSLILRKSGGKSLWEIAKHCGSTVEAIQEANGLTSQPPAEQMLLIPVL